MGFSVQNNHSALHIQNKPNEFDVFKMNENMTIDHYDVFGFQITGNRLSR